MGEQKNAKGSSLGKVKFAKVDDIKIAYKVLGKKSGTPLILIMGYCGTMDLWPKKMLDELSSKYKLIIFDNRGMGKSTSSEKKFTIELFAEDTAGLMKALKIEKAHILGWSMGTYIAQELAVRYPHKVGQIVLYAADCGGFTEAKLPNLKVMWDLWSLDSDMGDLENHPQEVLKLLFPREWVEKNPDYKKYMPPKVESSSPESINRQFKAILSWGGCSKISGIKKQVLLITGDSDIVTPPENSRIIARHIVLARIVEMKGCGHGAMYQDPEEFSRIVLGFLEND